MVVGMFRASTLVAPPVVTPTMPAGFVVAVASVRPPP